MGAIKIIIRVEGDDDSQLTKKKEDTMLMALLRKEIKQREGRDIDGDAVGGGKEREETMLLRLLKPGGRTVKRK